jgi:hypothetical protein
MPASKKYPDEVRERAVRTRRGFRHRLLACYGLNALVACGVPVRGSAVLGRRVDLPLRDQPGCAPVTVARPRGPGTSPAAMLAERKRRGGIRGSAHPARRPVALTTRRCPARPAQPIIACRMPCGQPDPTSHGLSRRQHRPPNTQSAELYPSRPVGGYVQRRATTSRCQRSSVDGVTRNAGHRSRGSRADIANTRRSCGVLPRPGRLPAHHHQLMPQHRYLDVLGIRLRRQTNQAENPPDDHKRQRPSHHTASLPDAVHPGRRSVADQPPLRDLDPECQSQQGEPRLMRQ